MAASSCSTTDASTAGNFPKPLTVGSPPFEDSGHRRLVELHDDLRPGHPGGHGRHMGREPLGERLREVPARPGVYDGAVAAGPLESGGQRPRPGRLHLEGPRVVIGDVGQRVEVSLQELPAPAAGPCPTAAPAATPPA